MSAPPFPPVPPDVFQIERQRCSICHNKVRRPIIDAALDRGVAAAVISREQTETGWPIGQMPVARHRRHYVSQAPVSAALAKHDLAEIVRDRTVEAIMDGRLNIGDDSWRNVAPGLRAQVVIEQRARQVDTNRVLLAFARMLGGGQGVPADALALPDGNTIDGEYDELA